MGSTVELCFGFLIILSCSPIALFKPKNFKAKTCLFGLILVPLERLFNYLKTRLKSCKSEVIWESYDQITEGVSICDRISAFILGFSK